MGTTGVVMMVGQWFARYLVGKVMDNLADKALSSSSDNDNMLIDVKAMLKNVEDRLPRIQAVIHAAEGKPINSPVLRNWLRELKDAAYEADDVLDDFESEQLHDQLDESSKVTAFASSAFKFLEKLFVADDMLGRLKNLVGDLDEIYLDIDCKTAELDEESSKENSASRETSSFIREELIGRDKERDKILRMFLHSEDETDFGHKVSGTSSYPSLGVLPIVGIGGVGKTALAQLIYNDPLVAKYFEVRKWMYVADDFGVRRILEEMIDDCPNSSDVMLRRLKIRLENRRFLLVLDDVWEETGSALAAFCSALTSGAKGSTILVTTQSTKVADIMGTMDPIHLEPLEHNDFWRLFKHFVFGDKELNKNFRLRLELIGREISNKLHGLPLAGKALGSLLRTRFDEQFWNTILESEWWEEDFVAGKILPSLGLSYQHLSANLKQCFAYTSIFPKGYVFQKERLVQMWMAQGFIQSQSQGTIMTAEDLGSMIFDELSNRYFFLRKQDGGYMMHDLIRELAVCVSLDECFVVNDEPVEIPATVRHLTLRAANLDALRDIHKYPKVRTIMFYQDCNHEEFHEVLENILKNVKSLRVLDFSYIRKGIRKLPDAICDLSHLRYLDISDTEVRQLPKSIYRLCHLQVLNLKRCFSLDNLPIGMNRLINLRHLYAEAKTINLIDGIGKLTNLQELEEFHVTWKRGHRIEELKELRNIRRKLVIESLEKIESKVEAKEAKLKDKEHLDHLCLRWSICHIGYSGREIIDGLEPHGNLKAFTITNYGGLILRPSWLVSNQHLTNLQSVFLSNCAMCESLPPFGQLPFLKILHINTPAVKRIGVEFYGDADPAFPWLEELEFVSLYKLEEWSEADSRQFLPRLRSLKISRCHMPRKVPLVHLSSSLKHLRLDFWGYCEYLPMLTSLVTLELGGRCSMTDQKLSVSLSNLRNLQLLQLVNYPELRLHGGIRSLTSLKELIVEKCYALFLSSQLDQTDNEQILTSLSSVRADESLLIYGNVLTTLGRLPSLRKLDICRCKYLFRWTDEQDEWLRQLTSLEALKFDCCRRLYSLPTSLVAMSSIKRLEIRGCPDIKSLPERGLPMSLKELHIVDCPTLQNRCTETDGEDWMKIAHIPDRRIHE